MKGTASVGSSRFRQALIVLGVAMLVFALGHYYSVWTNRIEDVEYYKLLMAGRVTARVSGVPSLSVMMASRVALHRARFLDITLGLAGVLIVVYVQYGRRLLDGRRIK